MLNSPELMRLVIGWTCVGVFVATAMAVVLDLFQLFKLAKDIRLKLYGLLVFEIVAIGVAAFGNLIELDPGPLKSLLAQAEVSRGNEARIAVTAGPNPVCIYSFETKPPSPYSNEIHDGTFWYGAPAECPRLDPVHRQVFVQGAEEVPTTFLDNYYSGRSETLNGRVRYEVGYHMPPNTAGAERRAYFYWPGKEEVLKITQRP